MYHQVLHVARTWQILCCTLAHKILSCATGIMSKAVHQVNSHVKMWEICGTALQLRVARSSLLVSFVHVSPTQHPAGVFYTAWRFMVSTKPPNKVSGHK